MTLRKQRPKTPARTARPNPRDATLEAAARRRIEADSLVPEHGTVLVAVSGGADSIALLHFLVAERARVGRPESLAVAHVNHGLRGADADADATFVRDRAATWGVPFFEVTLAPSAAASEDALRRARYAALVSLAERADASCTATAHNADDQAETVLFRMARGSGLRGLGGMPSKGRVHGVAVVRPFLDVTREQVIDYLQRHGVQHRMDATNQSLRPARNKIRHEILPRLEAGVSAGVRKALLRQADLFREADEYLEVEARRHLEASVVERDEGKIILAAARLLDYPKLLRTYVFRCALQELNGAIRDFTWAHLDALLSLVTQSSGRSIDLPHGMVARRERGRIVLARRFREPATLETPSNT
ncbi:MAG TPA: tRNA lysidine(34) synthetase TilS [Candidatus Eisenbacteria bacterium]|nr:tRNA lysidine(34) synthetase TilS [Candidatus Eisenbacteria bacterium]